MSPHNTCPDCGNAPTIHWIERWSALTDAIMHHAFGPIDALRREMEPILNPIYEKNVLYCTGILSALHLGNFLHKPDDNTPLRARCFWEEAKKRGISMYEFRLLGHPLDLYLARHNNKTLVFDGLPRPGNCSSQSLDWMDNKGEMKRRFILAGIPVAKGDIAHALHTALTIFNGTPHPVIVKPHIGSRSRHTTVHINDEATLAIAFAKAKQLSPWAIVEQELRGSVYRATVIGGRLVGVLRRDPAYVVGNGHLKISTLVEIENKNHERNGSIFHHIPMDATATEVLQKQDYTWSSIPKAGIRVELGLKTSRGAGGTTTDVTDITHSDNIELFENVGKVLNDPLVGLDFIISDIAKSWKYQEDCGVIECNSLPFIDLHEYPFTGKPRDTAGALWDLVFPNTSTVQEV